MPRLIAVRFSILDVVMSVVSNKITRQYNQAILSLLMLRIIVAEGEHD
ncbi:MAG TPA: hypothetical protein V6C81_04035 [Planktothrix sp.]